MDVLELAGSNYVLRLLEALTQSPDGLVGLVQLTGKSIRDLLARVALCTQAAEQGPLLLELEGEALAFLRDFVATTVLVVERVGLNLECGVGDNDVVVAAPRRCLEFGRRIVVAS